MGAAFAGATWLAVAQLASGLAALQWALVAALAAVTTRELRRRRDHEKRARALRYLLSAVLAALGEDERGSNSRFARSHPGSVHFAEMAPDYLRAVTYLTMIVPIMNW